MKQTKPEERHERAGKYYPGSNESIKGRRAISDNKSIAGSSITATQESLTFGRDKGNNGQTMASGRKKRRWWARTSMECGFICANNNIDVGQTLSLQRNGTVFGGE